MSTVAQELEGRASSLGAGIKRTGQRLQVSPASYQAANPALWVVGFLLVAFVGLLPFFAGIGDILLAQQALTLGLLALSLNILVATTGLISFGHAMFFALGAYLTAVPFAKDVAGLENPLFAFALTPVMGAVSAFLIGLIVFRGRELYFALLTLGVGQLIWAGIHGWQSLTGGTNGTTGVFAAEWLNPFVHLNTLYWFLFGCTLACAVLIYI
ncbi:MAG: ABC transporter permease subunit, partial [Gaiellaceae bacterium]